MRLKDKQMGVVVQQLKLARGRIHQLEAEKADTLKQAHHLKKKYKALKKRMGLNQSSRDDSFLTNDYSRQDGSLY